MYNLDNRFIVEMNVSGEMNVYSQVSVRGFVRPGVACRRAAFSWCSVPAPALPGPGFIIRVRLFVLFSYRCGQRSRVYGECLGSHLGLNLKAISYLLVL